VPIILCININIIIIIIIIIMRTFIIFGFLTANENYKIFTFTDGPS
jgi:hypothetical protein